MTLKAMTEYLAIDLEAERWECRRCGQDLGSARDNYKKGLVLRTRNSRAIHSSGLDQPRLCPDPQWCAVVEFFCPSCATLIEVEYLPPGHPLTYDIRVDVDALKQAEKRKEAKWVQPQQAGERRST